MITKFKIFESWFSDAKTVDVIKLFGEHLKSNGNYGIIYRNTSTSDGYQELLNLAQHEYLKYFEELKKENERNICYTIIRNEDLKIINGFQETEKIKELRNIDKYNL